MVHVPTWSTVVETGSLPGWCAPSVTSWPAESGASPGLITQTSCWKPAVAGKFHRTTSPVVALSVFGLQLEG